MDQQGAARFNNLTSMSPATSGLYPAYQPTQPEPSQINQLLPTAPMIPDRPQQQAAPEQEANSELQECLMTLYKTSQQFPNVNQEFSMAARLILQGMAKLGLSVSNEGGYPTLS